MHPTFSLVCPNGVIIYHLNIWYHIVCISKIYIFPLLIWTAAYHNLHLDVCRTDSLISAIEHCWNLWLIGSIYHERQLSENGFYKIDHFLCDFLLILIPLSCLYKLTTRVVVEEMILLTATSAAYTLGVAIVTDAVLLAGGVYITLLRWKHRGHRAIYSHIEWHQHMMYVLYSILTWYLQMYNTLCTHHAIPWLFCLKWLLPPPSCLWLKRLRFGLRVFYVYMCMIM